MAVLKAPASTPGRFWRACARLGAWRSAVRHVLRSDLEVGLRGMCVPHANQLRAGMLERTAVWLRGTAPNQPAIVPYMVEVMGRAENLMPGA